ncbi:Transcription initiation factor TFIID subunit 13 [Geranomyces variabilis]|nr:transcription initiation factor IID, 18kD subunit-domain-containing protein [Geranomyces variabilis]KAJ3134349.1 Transcription initiation factor TFIID subunit 13 [Geranomyces variabilis]KAJ3144788.1 Transcription initiation factor TFIID subunit 13 [Geranomyces variabilis]
MRDPPRAKLAKRPFTREVSSFMYGFGDVKETRPDSAELMEEMLLTYLSDMCAQVKTTARKPKTADFLHVLRKDPKKLARAHELLGLDQEIRNARKAFDAPEAEVKRTGATGATLK